MLRHSRLFLTMALTLLLSACPGQRRGEVPAQAEPGPLKPVSGARLFQVVPERSLVRILVYRAGALAQAGHNHVIASHALEGKIYLHEDLRKSAFELIMPVGSLTVDEAQLRRQEDADFPPEVPDSAKLGTRQNMLSAAVLDAGHYAAIRLVSSAIEGAGEHLDVRVRIGVKGKWTEHTAPVRLKQAGDELTASGEFSLKQTELGLEPFSALLGALKVQDEMKVKFAVTARAR